jgi:hypothetical protein
VIDAATGNVLTTLATLANTRKSLEIDWAGGVPIATSGRVGVGYLTEAPGQAPAGGLLPTLSAGLPGGQGAAIIRGLTISPKAFRAVRTVSTVGRGGASGGATIRYSDSEPAITRFTVLAQRPGIKTTKRGCARPARGSGIPRAKRCTRYIAVGAFSHRDRRGHNSLRLTGSVGGRRLAPGQYRLAAVPTIDGRVGARSAASFRIMR